MKMLEGYIRAIALLPIQVVSGDAVGAPVDTHGMVAATGSVTIPTNPSNTHTVTIGGKVYTFQSSLTDVDGNVKIGASAALTQANLKAAINLDGGTPGTDYATSMTRNKTVDASTPVADVITLTARAAGKAGNDITLSEAMSGTGNVVSGATLSGGRDGEQYDTALVRIAVGNIANTPDSVAVIIQESDTADFASASTCLGGESQTVVADTIYTKQVTRTKKFIRASIDFTGGSSPTAEMHIDAILCNWATPFPVQA